MSLASTQTLVASASGAGAMAAWQIHAFWIACVVAAHLTAPESVRDFPAIRHRRRLRGANAANPIADDIAVKISNMSSAIQLYSLMVRYNKEYCDNAIVSDLENLAKSPESKASLMSMKTYCNQAAKKQLTRSLQRRELKSVSRLGSEAHQIQTIIKKHHRSKTGCKPKKTLVELPPSAESIYLPRCTNIKRCTGCCPNKLHVCRPVIDAIKMLDRKVVEIHVNIMYQKPTMKVKVLQVEQHSECECRCPVPLAQCPPKFEYDEQNCSCQCTDFTGSKFCHYPKFWNATSCSCECVPSNSCRPDHHRDPGNCKCRRNDSIDNLTTKVKKKKKKKRNYFDSK